MTERKAVIKNADMSEEMQQDAVDCATQALEKYNIEKDIAAFIKKGIRQEIQPDLALYCWKKLWQLRYSRDSAFHLFLFGTSCYSTFQKWLKSLKSLLTCHLLYYNCNY